MQPGRLYLARQWCNFIGPCTQREWNVALGFKRISKNVIVRNLFGNAKKKQEKREKILGEFKKGYLADLKEVKATGGKRYVALSEPFLQQESSSLPVVHGISVAGKAVVLPQDISGSVALVLLWTREHGQKTCDIYREAFAKEFENSKNTEYYEVNIIDSWLFRLMKTFISKNLRGQVPLHRQENFLCCYENTSILIEAIFENTLVGHAVLVDHAGFIRWKAHGTPSDEELTHLINCTIELQNEIAGTALGVK